MRIGIILLAAAGSLATAAVAQPAGGVPPRSAEDQVMARTALRTFAACLLQSNARAANDILQQPLASVAQQAAIDRRVTGGRACDNAGTGFNALTLAGALAEANLQTRFATRDAGRLANLSRDAIALANLEPRNGYEDLGLCVVRRAPEAVRAWALSEPGSAAESAARGSVVPQVAGCVDQGQPLRADYVGLRAILSVALYRALRQTRP